LNASPQRKELIPFTRIENAYRLEKTWQPPGVEPWIPLPEYPDWRPLDEQLDPIAGVQKSREGPVVNVLSDECVQALRDFWNGSSATHFHCYPITAHASFKTWRKHADYFDKSNIWWCSSLKNAAAHYSWTPYLGGSFGQLAAALQSAIRSHSALFAAVVCLKILDWGGVRHRSRKTLHWIISACRSGTLIRDLVDATSLLCPASAGALSVFGTPYPSYPMNSGSTKLFAAVALELSSGIANPKQDVIIFDGRVGSGSALLARKAMHPRTIPSKFRFPEGPEKKRRSGCPTCGVFQVIHRLSDADRAEYARTASRCIQQVIGVYRPNAEFVSAEKALFMIGYDVANRCGKCSSSCP
jgi:hypothetical protein